MTISADVLKALRELADTKQLERSELTDLLRDGIHAALVKRYGPNVRAEIEIDDLKGEINTMVLRSVVDQVEDEGSQISLEEARWEDPDFQVGDVLEEEVPFEAFGRLAVQAAKQKLERSIASRRDIAAGRIIEEADMMLLSPGDGLRWTDRGKIVGKRAVKPIPKHSIIHEEDVEDA